MAYEKMKSWTIWNAGIFSILIVWALIVFLQAAFYFANKLEKEEKVLAKGWKEREAYEAVQRAKLTGFGVANKETGEVAIPVEVAAGKVLAELN